MSEMSTDVSIANPLLSHDTTPSFQSGSLAAGLTELTS